MPHVFGGTLLIIERSPALRRSCRKLSLLFYSVEIAKENCVPLPSCDYSTGSAGSDSSVDSVVSGSHSLVRSSESHENPSDKPALVR